ncbi:diguanylate cyclase [Marinimicrobium sp. ABcell2]|uniref:diguanylate cyclase n=1 Tax=Marinimicrobium sp. ABcell2 TaxID=3069751 RepID=UPI0027B0ED87|nr:diguanylate cyclase [Marinimicrobium sp. ABcell2]MDQ2077213.1 diguanylate cyclase [Marinimicrobium sp. ABcell2]
MVSFTRQLARCACLVLTAFVASPLWAQPQVIHLNQPLDDNGKYAYAALELALSEIDHNYQIEIRAGEQTQARTIEEVASGALSIMWAATNQEMEDALRPVRIPLYKGLLGHRIFIIHKDSQARFNRVETFEDLKQISFGQGTTWADTEILRHNGLEVVTANKFDSLFYMVDGGRFDAFPRGVQEPWSEVPARSHLDLAVERRVMLVYRMPFYLFVSKANEQLAQDLERGLSLAIANGRFDELFFGSPMVQSVLELANLQERLTFQLENPTLPPETPVDREELWLDLDSL